MSNENKPLDPKLEAALKGVWESLTDEQKEKAKACKTIEELTRLAGEEGVELPDELLDAVAGGYIEVGGLGIWNVIDDATGYAYGDHYATAEEARAEARRMGLSQEEITYEDMRRLQDKYEKSQRKGGC